MIQVIYKLLRKGLKYALLVGLIGLFTNIFGQFLLMLIYHINMSVYFFMSAFFSNGVIALITLSMLFMFIMYIIKLIKRLI